MNRREWQSLLRFFVGLLFSCRGFLGSASIAGNWKAGIHRAACAKAGSMESKFLGIVRGEIGGEPMTNLEAAATPTNDDPAVQSLKPGVNFLAWIGPIVTFGGAISYFTYFIQFADSRDFPWVNLLLIALGVILSVVGLWRVFSIAEYRILSKAFASLGFLFSAAIGGLFCFLIFSLSYQLPGIEGVSQVADKAPAFSLSDQDNKKVRLDDFAGKKLVIAFYRGYW